MVIPSSIASNIAPKTLSSPDSIKGTQANQFPHSIKLVPIEKAFSQKIDKYLEVIPQKDLAERKITTDSAHIQSLEQKAKTGDLSACAELGLILLLSADKERGLTLLNDAAQQGYAPAEHNLGLLALQEGDYANALNHFERAAQAGIADAQYNCALLYLTGPITLQDPQKGSLWMEQAARQGIPDAIYNLEVINQNTNNPF